MRFSDRGIHDLVHAEEFCDFADEVRNELLRHSTWREMQHFDRATNADRALVAPARQNGITTGHVQHSLRDELPSCARFAQYLVDRADELCAAVGLPPSDLEIEMNAMAYGEGCWLTGHNDVLHELDGNKRVAAWMLYLTHPDDGEWSEGQGGATRVWLPDGSEQRLRPKFNRFAMFRVYEQSYHEVEKITAPCDWEHCRLALSGWLTTPTVGEATRMLVYRISADHVQEGLQKTRELDGGAALYRLLLQQQQYADQDTARVQHQLAQIEVAKAAQDAAPPGTTYLTNMPGPKGCIVIVDRDDKTVYFGPRDEYQP